MTENEASTARRGRPKGSKNKPRTPEKEIATGKVERIPLDLIDIDDTTFRFRVKMRLGNLPESIEDNGQQFPVLLRRRSGTNRFQIISGFRRITALQKLRWSHVNAIIREDLDDDAEACRVSVIENEIRQTYNDLDRAYAILAYRDMGKSNAEIAELFKVGTRQLMRLKKLVQFPQALQDAVADDKVSSTNAVRLMQYAGKYYSVEIEEEDEEGKVQVVEEIDSEWVEKELPAWIERISQGMTYKELNKALKEAASQEKEAEAVELFVIQEKGGKQSMRVRPIAINEDLSEADRKELVKQFNEALQFLKALPKVEATA